MGVQSPSSPTTNQPTNQPNRIKMKTSAILLATTVGLSLAAPQNAPVWTEITGAYKTESGLKVVRPTTKAALAYMKEFFGEDLCSAAAQAYMESLLSGESGAKASEAAEIAYKAAWRAGARVEPGSPCASAEASFRSSYDSGKDRVTDAALSFANSWPGLEEGNPCSVSTKTYMESIIGGKSTEDAGLSAAKAFIGAFADLAKSGNKVIDGSCSKAAKAFIRNSNGPDFAASDAAQSFIDATLSSNSKGYDPVCTDAALAYMEAYADGKDQLTSTLLAAKTFYKSLSGGSLNPSSPCVKANLAFAAKSPLSDSKSNAAMAAFIDKAVADGNAVADPVCAAATLAFLDAKIAKSSDKEASSAAADAYIEANAANNGKRSEACRKAAEAYISLL